MAKDVEDLRIPPVTVRNNWPVIVAVHFQTFEEERPALHEQIAAITPVKSA